MYICIYMSRLVSMMMIGNLLRGTVSVVEIVFVGQCEVLVCLDFVLTFCFPWLRSS